jgi:predicted dehydrogenase
MEVMSTTRRTLVRNLLTGTALSPLPLSGPRSRRRKEDQVLHCRSRTHLPRPFHASLQDIARAEVVALVSGHREKTEKYAAEYNFPAKNIYSYSNYDDIAANKDIDAVYIALPSSMHAEYTIRAAIADKHVLCEKPMATSLRGSQSMINACRAANRKLMMLIAANTNQPTCVPSS